MTDVEVLPVLGMDEPYRYRNKAQFPIGTDKDGNPVAGFYAGRTHSIIPCTDCMLGEAVNAEILSLVLDHMKKYHIPAYDEITGEGLVRHVLIRSAFATGERMVCLVLNGDQIPGQEELAEQLRKISGMTSVMGNINRERSNVILGNRVFLIWGKTYITDKIGDVSYQISPLSFYQVNPVQTQKLYETALSYAGLTGTETVWDLYCGIGTISLFLARKAKKVYGVEIVPQAIADARRNAKLNDIQNAEFFVGKSEEVLPAYYQKNGGTADVIVVDPPRKGCDETLLDTIARMAACAGGICQLRSGDSGPGSQVSVRAEGIRWRRCSLWICLAHTVHVETVVLLSQQKPDDTIEIDLDLDELDATSAELKATYQEIKDYVLKEFGLKVSSLYISQVKRKCGIEVGENYNLPKSENARVPQCPNEKEDAIKAALKYYAMI